ncbi:MAG: amino acid racemase [Syntrophomonadaceae bacterium]|nr:amino acid racemase [Syntrophomonadaceae bacterium]
MKKVGLVGGLGPASTIDYYREIVEIYRKEKGDDNYPAIVIDSINMGELVRGIESQNFNDVARQLLNSVANLAQAGASFAAIASNSPHVVWDLIKDRASIPLISIVDATCDRIIRQNYNKVLIFATKFTMKNGLYSTALSKRNINWVLPNEEDIEILGNIIYPNLENGIVIEQDKQKMVGIAEKYIKQHGADSILLGCTEIPLMIKPGDVSVPVINTTEIHIEKICAMLMR